MKYTSKKGTVIHIPDGIDPKQIAKIKADADAGYGTRAQQTAKALGKKLGKGGDTTTTEDPTTTTTTDSVVDTTKLDQQHTFDPNDPYWQQLYDTTYNNQYGLATHGVDAQKARDLEAAKQEAAERGIPFDPGNRESAYGRAIGGVNDRYDDIYSQARGQAYAAAQGVYSTQGGLANDSFTATLQEALGISEAEARVKANEIAKYGIDQDTKTKMAAVKAQKEANAIAAKRSGGGGHSSGGGDGGGGFEVVG